MIDNLDPDPGVTTLSVIGIDALRVILELASATPPEGCFVELGVYRGGSAWHLARLAHAQSRAIHLFDTFTGIPECTFHDLQHKVGDFNDADLAAVRALIPSAIFHVGTFPDTMTEIGPIAFAHIDCDQYISCLAAIEHFWPRVVPNGVMLFDDYFATSGVTKAVNETFGSRRQLTGGRKAFIVKDSL